MTTRGHDGNGELTDQGVITRLETPSVFAYRYRSTNHGTEDREENRMTIGYRLREADDGSTDLQVDHGNLLTPAREELMDGVWDHLLRKLAAPLDEPTSG